MLKGIPTDRFLTVDKDGGPESQKPDVDLGRNARSWVLWFNQIAALLRQLDTSIFGFVFPANIQVIGLPSRNYADDVAAEAGGVPVGGIYHNAGAVRVRLV